MTKDVHLHNTWDWGLGVRDGGLGVRDWGFYTLISLMEFPRLNKKEKS